GPARTEGDGTMASSELDYCTGAELVALLAARKVSAVELFERSVLRIEARDKAINAVVVRDFERARDAAKAADAAVAREEGRSLRKKPTMAPACQPRGASRRARISDPRKMLSASGGSRPLGPSFSGKPTCRSRSPIGRVTMTSTAPQTIPGIRRVLPAAHRE